MATLVDTGPLVALLNAADQRHQDAVERFRRAERPWLTCEAVLSEAHFLLGRARRGTEALGALLERQALMVGYSARGDEAALVRLLAKYRDVPMSVADACLVRLSEQLPRERLLSFDDDFSVYRRADRRVVPRLA
jgi:predicted nucleic acid-binding protein